MSHPMLIVSNRLPIQVGKDAEGGWQIRPGAGGLVTALRPILKQYGGSWVGWPGDCGDAPVDELLGRLGGELNCRFHGVELSPELVEGFYYGFSNETLWPLFHDLLGHAKFDREKWLSYAKSNRIFAEVLHKAVRDDELVWVHDYQLILVGHYLREQGLRNKLAYFLHIPFPPPDIFARLPWRAEILRALLAYDLVGFQVQRDLRNFTQCVRQFVREARTTVQRQIHVIDLPGRRVRAGAFPISIDFREFDSAARSKEVQDTAWYIHENFPEQQLALGVDRLDYTKGIAAKFLAFERALEKYPDLRGKISLIQLVVPSRQDIPEYAAWKEKLDALVGRINGRFDYRGWAPLHYMYRSLSRMELLGYYRASEICLVTSLKDGMNLVAKEYCAASVDDHGALILSEFAGSAPQMREGAIIVNPLDREATADAIYQAFHMSREERRSRMRRLRREVRRNDVFRWVRTFLDQVRAGEEPQAPTPVVSPIPPGAIPAASD